jgi:hypothetical protein
MSVEVYIKRIFIVIFVLLYGDCRVIGFHMKYLCRPKHKVMVKLHICIFKYHAVKACGGMEV